MDKELLHSIAENQAALGRRWAKALLKEWPDEGAETLKSLREALKDHLLSVVECLVTGDCGLIDKFALDVPPRAYRAGLNLIDVLKAIGAGRRVIVDYLTDSSADKPHLIDGIKETFDVYDILESKIASAWRRFERERGAADRAVRRDDDYSETSRRLTVVEKTAKSLGELGVQILLLDEKRRVLWANASARENFKEEGGIEGWTCGQLRGIPPGVCEECPSATALKSAKPERGVVSVERNGGKEFYEVTAFPILGDDGRPNRLLELVRRAPEMTTTVETTGSGEEYYRILFEHSGAAVCVLDENKTITRTNRRFCLMTGYSKEEVEGKLSFLDIIADAERPRMAKYHEQRRVNPSAAPTSYEFTFRNRSGEERRAHVTVGLVPGTRESICSIRDTTEEEQTKEFLESVLHGSADAIIGLDSSDKIVSWNMGAEQLFGYRDSDVIGRHFSLLVPRDVIDSGEMERINRETRRMGSLKNYETERITKDGRRIKVNLTRSALRDKFGKYRGTSAIVRDVTEQKTLEQQVIHAEKLAAIGQLTAGLAHEMGTPLNIISGRAEYLMSDLAPDDPRRDSLNVIIHQTERMAQLINNLLEFSRPQKVQYAKLDLADVIKGVISLLEAHLTKNKIKVDLVRAPETPMIEADYHQLQQVFLNLILNSIQAMPKGGTIELRLDPSSDGRTVKIFVADTGNGIPEENLPRVFDPFFTTKDSGQGTGLGLAIVAKILRDHGGSVAVDSRMGVGATFGITLPLTQRRVEDVLME